MGYGYFINTYLIINILMLCITLSLSFIAWSVENMKIMKYMAKCVKFCIVNACIGLVGHLLESRDGEIVFVVLMIITQVVYVLSCVMDYRDTGNSELIINAGLYVIITSLGLIGLVHINPIKIGI